MRSTWLFTPDPSVGEGLLGYIRRIARENGYPTVGYLVNGRFGRVAPKKVMSVLDPRTERIYRSASELINLHPEHFNLLRRRICPDCWRHAQIELASWEWKLGVVCSEHHCYLVDSCPHCKQIWQGGLARLGPCCEQYLLTATTEKASGAVVELMSRLMRAWETNDVALYNGGAGLTWVEWMHLIQFIGGYATRAAAPRPSRPAGLHCLLEARTVVSATADALMNWPQGFKHYLDCQLRQDPMCATEPIGLKKAFGRFYKQLFVTMKGQAFDGLRVEFARYVSDHLPYLITRRNQFLLRHLDKPPTWSTLSWVSNQTRQSKRRVACMVKAGTIDGLVQRYSSGRESILIRTVEGTDGKSTKDTLLTLTAVATSLGLKKARVIQLVEAGLIRTAYRHNALEQWTVLKSSIEQFLARPKVLDSARALVSFKWLIQCKLTTPEFIGLVRAVMDGELCLANSPSERVSDWSFDRDVVDEWIKVRRRVSAVGFTIPQAAIELGIKQQVAYDLVRVGLLQSEYTGTKHAARVIPPSALLSFRKDLIALSELAKRTQCSPRKMLVKLAANGVLPVTGPSVDGGRQYYVRRCEVLTSCFARSK